VAIPAHVGIYGNEKADRPAEAAMKRAHKAVPRTAAEAQDRILEEIATGPPPFLVSVFLSTAGNKRRALN